MYNCVQHTCDCWSVIYMSSRDLYLNNCVIFYAIDFPFPSLNLHLFLLSFCPMLLDIYQNPVWFSDLGHTVHFNLSIWEINLWKNELKSEVRQLECRPADRLTIHGGLMRTHPQVNGTKADRFHCLVCWLESITSGSCAHISTVISPHAAKADIQK